MMCTRPVLERCKTGSVELVERPCGVCPSCKMNIAKSWSYRLYAENKLHKKSCFVTLTYNDECITKLQLSKDGIYSLDKSEAQKFMKRLRKNYGEKIRFFLVGEYGESSSRPHYHLILFGIGQDDTRVIERSWPFGFVYVGDVSPASIGYVARYCTKKLFSDRKMYDVQPEFSLMSNRPGIGYNAIDKGVHKTDDGMYVWFQGSKMAVPKYFKEKLKNAYDTYVSRLASQRERDTRKREYENSGKAEHLEQLQCETNILARRSKRKNV